MMFGDFMDKLPKGVELSEHLREKAHGYCRVLFSGLYYYMPITKEMKKVSKISKKNGKYVFDVLKTEYMFEEMMRDIVYSVYLQVRDVIASESTRTIIQNISNSFEKFLGDGINKMVVNSIDKDIKKIGYKEKKDDTKN